MKKRILSLILALSMVLSVLPLGAFAEGSTNSKELIMKDGLPDCSNNTSGNGWEYSRDILILNDGAFDFSSTHPQGGGEKTTTPVACAIVIESGATITGGIFTGGDFEKEVTNYGTISGGTFQNGCIVTNYGTIKGNGTFSGTVQNTFGGRISGGTFNGTVTNRATISGGTFEGTVTNDDTISGGIFEGTVTNGGTIEKGTFNGGVTNDRTISGGTFDNEVENKGMISGGTFKKKVENTGGTISGGVFNGKTTPKPTKDAYTITLDTVNARITEVNDVSVDELGNENFYVYAGTTVTITASTEIYSLNGKSIGTGNYNSEYSKPNDKTTVKFTMPKENVELGTGGLVMDANGYPVGSEGGTANCEGKGWKYSKKDTSNPTGKLTLESVECDFSFTHPTTKTGNYTDQPVACEIETILGVQITGGIFSQKVTIRQAVEITGGTFNGPVENNGGIIYGGSFNGEVTNDNHGGIFGTGTFNGTVSNIQGIIQGGKFEGDVTNSNNGGIFDGTFESTSSVTNSGAIEKGTFNGDVTNDTTGKIFGGTFAADKKVENKGTITEYGTFGGTVINNDGGIISGGTFQSTSSVENKGTINGNGTFNGTVTNDTGGTISGGTFASDKTVENKGTIENGTFDGTVTNNNTISGGIFKETCSVTNNGIITGDGDFNGTVINNAQRTISGGTFQSMCSVVNYGTITGNGTFNGTVTNYNGGSISKGTFNGTVTNYNGGSISKGTFVGTVENVGGTISGGTFQSTSSVENSGTINNGTFAGNVTNSGTVNGGVFNRNATLINVTGGHNITWDTAYPNAKIEKVNDVSVDWPPYAYKGTTMTITARTDIYSLNGKSLDESSYPDTTDKKTVTITMPDEDVVLNRTAELEVAGGEIESGETAEGSGRVRIGGKVEVTTKDKTQDFVGWTIAPEGIELRHDDGSAVDLTSERTFSFMMPDVSGGKLTLTAKYQPFRTSLLMNADGTVNLEHVNHETYDGNETCKGDGWNVFNRGTLILENGTYDFRYTAPTEKTGTLEAVTCEVQNKGGTIENGVFRNLVLNEVGGTITGGTFAVGLFEMPGTTSGSVTGGVFNGKTGLTNAHHVTVTDGSLLKVNGEDPLKVDETTGAVTPGTAWDLYAYAGTTMTITANTEIFSLNGQPISTGNCNSSYGSDKTAVTFTMPDDKDVVLNEEINYGDLVMKNGWPKDSNSGSTACKGNGWEYIPNDPNFGNVLFLTSSRLTGGQFAINAIAEDNGWQDTLDDSNDGDTLLLTGSSQTGGLFDFSTIGDGSPVKCNVFVGMPTAITGGVFDGTVFNNSGILGGTFNGPVVNTTMGRIQNGTFNGAVENNGMIENGAFHKAVKNNATIENGTFHDEVENNGTINDGAFHGAVENNGTIENGTFHDAVENNHIINNGAFNGKVENTASGTINDGTFHKPVENNGTIEKGTFHDEVKNDGIINGGTFNGAVTGSGTVSGSITGSGTLNGEPITKTPEPEPKPGTKPEPEPEPKPKPKPEPEPKPETKPEPEPTTYTVTVIGGTIDGKTSVSAKENDTLTVVLDQSDIPDGMTFDLWSISSDKLSGDINVDYRAESMTFQMPAEDVTIRAQYRSAEIIEDAAPSPLATAATVAVGGAAAGVVVWQGVNLGVDLYLTSALPQGVPVPTDRRALALLLWETAGKPEVALPTLYGDVPAEEIELQKATRWAVQNGLMDAADKKDASLFDPDHYVTKMDVFGAWLRLKKLLGTT